MTWQPTHRAGAAIPFTPGSPTYRLRDISRAQQILRVCVRHGFGQVISSLPLHRIPGLGKAVESVEDPQEGTAPRRLVRAMQELGPTFVKLGQVLSTRPDILPESYLTEFATLQDQVPPFAGTTARTIIEDELGTEIEDVFDGFEDQPVASASIAQVHRAKLPDGTVVAVKVQRPGIEQTLRSDINILYLLADLFTGQLDLGVTSPVAIVEAFDRAVFVEIDFHSEAANAEAFSQAVADIEGVKVPRIHRALSSRRVLCMDWVTGVKLSDIDSTKADRQLVMDRLVEATYQQIFVSGIFHADPHPGNLVVDDNSTLSFLDFGLIGRITPEMRDTLESLFVGAVFRDPDTIARTLYRVGAAEGRVQIRQLSAEIEELLDRHGNIALQDQDTSRIALDVLEIARGHELKLPEQYAVLARSEVTLDGIARSLVPDWDPIEATRPYANRLAADRLDPQRMGGDLLRTVLSTATLLKDLPSQVDQLMLDLERGKLMLNTAVPELNELTRTLDRLGRALIFALGASAFLVSASTLMAVLVQQEAQSEGYGLVGTLLAFTVVVGLGLATLVAGGLITALLWNLFFKEPFQKIRWTWLLRFIPGLERGSRADRQNSR